DAAEHRRVGHAVAAQAIGAVHAAGVLAGRIEPGQFRRAVGFEFDAAHHVMRGRDHLDAAGGEIEAAIVAALDHALEFAPHALGAEMRHLDIDAAVRAGETLADAVHDRAADDVAGGALAARIVAE